MARRVAQLVAEAVAVLCPYCGEPQANKDGSQLWLKFEVKDADSTVVCQSCDAEMYVFNSKKVKFE